MSHKFIKPLIINLILLISIFSLFIFFDINYSSADNNKIKQSVGTKTNVKPANNIIGITIVAGASLTFLISSSSCPKNSPNKNL